MMICFFTSAADIYGENRLNPANGFIEELRRAVKSPCRALFICSDPEQYSSNDFFAAQLRGFMAAEGIKQSRCIVLDSRNAREAADLAGDCDLIILSGGHVPTQNAFFRKIGLRDILRGFDGVVVSISAGSMNSAGDVYAMPELPGEEADPDFRRSLPGLGLTDISVIPHFQYIRTLTLDGVSMEDIARKDSMNRRLYAISDGTYILARDGRRELRGEAYLIENGIISPLCGEGESVEL